MRGGVLRLAGYVAGVAITVASAAVLFRHLGVADSGRYVLVLSVVTLATSLTDAGLSSIGVRELALKRGGDRDAFMRSLLGVRIAFAVVGVGVACLYAAVAGLGAALVAGAAIAGAGVLAQNIQSTYATALMAELRLGWVTVAELARQLTTALAIVALAVAGAGLIPFFAIAPAATMLALVLTARLVRSSVPLVPSVRWPAWRELIAQTLPFALATAVGAVYFRLAILLVDLLSDDRQTGLFSASFRMVEVLVLVPQLMLAAALPIFSRAARDDEERLRYALGLVTQATVLVGLAVAIGFIFGAPIAIAIVGGPGFDGAVPVLQLHAMALLFSFTAAPFTYALLSLRRYRDILRLTLAGLTALTGALAILVPAYGAEGAAAATIVGELVLAAGGFALVARAGIAVRLRRLPGVLLAVVVAAVPGLLLPPLAGTVAALTLFAAVLLAVGAVPAELLDELRGWRSGRAERA